MIKVASFIAQNFTAGECQQLVVGHLVRTDAGHLLDDLLEDKQIKTFLYLKLIGNELQEARQLDRILLDDRTAERGQTEQPL